MYNAVGYKVNVKCLEHNHPLSQTNYLAECRQRTLNTEEKVRLSDLCAHKCPVSEIRECARSEFNKYLTGKDVDNLRSRIMPSAISLKEVLDKIGESGELRTHWTDNGELKHISFATSKMILIFHEFPEVVGIDATYNTNNMG